MMIINNLVLIAFTVFAQNNIILAQRQWVLPTTTAAEMRNPYTWYWPYAIAAAEGYREYFKNAQQITNQLYQQAYATQAFSWTTGQAGQAAGQITNPNWNGQGDQGGQGGQGGQSQWNGGQGEQDWNGPGFLEG